MEKNGEKKGSNIKLKKKTESYSVTASKQENGKEEKKSRIRASPRISKKKIKVK